MLIRIVHTRVVSQMLLPLEAALPMEKSNLDTGECNQAINSSECWGTLLGSY